MIQFDEYFFKWALQTPTCQENAQCRVTHDTLRFKPVRKIAKIRTFNFFFAVAAVGGGNPTSQLAGDFGLV